MKLAVGKCTFEL